MVWNCTVPPVAGSNHRGDFRWQALQSRCVIRPYVRVRYEPWSGCKGDRRGLRSRHGALAAKAPVELASMANDDSAGEGVQHHRAVHVPSRWGVR